MKIVIAGGGEVGFHLAKLLSFESLDITLIDIDKERLMFALRGYFEKKTIDADWEAINRMNNVELITTLSMICPFSATEQQALLVAEKVEDRASTMISLLEMANHEGDGIEDVKH